MSGGTRALSTVVGIVLLVGIVALGSIGILVVGDQINDESQAETESARLEQSFLELGRDLNTVARSDGERRVVDLSLPDDADSAVRETKTGRIVVTRTNFTTQTTDVLVNRSIGAIRYDGEETTLAYQAGAVFRGTDNGTQVLSNPGFEYSLSKDGSNPTLTLPVVTTVGPDALPNGEIRARKVASQSPVNDDTIVENDLVAVTVQSDYYVGWAAYFRSLAEKSGTAKTAVTVDHANETATLELIVPVRRRAIAGGVVVGADSATVTFGESVDISSYDSSQCAYNAGCGATRDNATVIVAGDLTLERAAHIGGDAIVGGVLDTNGSNTNALKPCPGSTPDSVICGNASYGTFYNDNSNGQLDTKGDIVGGWYNDNASLVAYEPVTTIVDAKVNQLRDENDNDGEDDISGNDLVVCNAGCEFDSGVYYLEEIRESGPLQNGNVVFNTTDGPITIAVNGSVDFSKTDVDVRGDGRLNIYVDSAKPGTCTPSGGSGCDFDFRGGNVTVRNASGNITDDATRVWVYMDEASSATFRTSAGGSAQFTGVLFGPGSGSNSGVNVTVGEGVTVKGALVGKVNASSQDTDIIYDRRLRDTETIVSTTKVPRLTFLVVSTYVVEVEDD